MISPGSAPARNTLSSPRTTPRRPPGAPSRAPTPRRRHFEMPAFWDSNSNFKKQKKKLFFQLLSIQPARATQSMMYLPLRVNRFEIIILLIVKYKYLKSCSKHFILQNLILDARLCSTGFITQPSWLSDFPVTNMVRRKRFVLAVYQYQKASRGGRPLNIFT